MRDDSLRHAVRYAALDAEDPSSLAGRRVLSEVERGQFTPILTTLDCVCPLATHTHAPHKTAMKQPIRAKTNRIGSAPDSIAKYSWLFALTIERKSSKPMGPGKLLGARLDSIDIASLLGSLIHCKEPIR